jgi:IclR family KDG regulon transcriptional repressor
LDRDRARIPVSDLPTRCAERRSIRLKALDKTLRVLDLFTTDRPQWGLLELSQTAELPISTLHRIVTVLRQHGLLTQDPQTKGYRLGIAAIDLGRRAQLSLPIRQIAQPIMRRLSERTGETVVMTVLNDQSDRAVCIERIASRFDLRMHLEVGEQSYLHAGASAKVLLAYLPAEHVDDLARRVGLPALAQNTITDLGDLKIELEKIRKQGYAFSREETDPGAWGMAAPVLGASQDILAGLGLASPISRYSEESERLFTGLTVEAAKELRRALGANDGLPAIGAQ